MFDPKTTKKKFEDVLVDSWVLFPKYYFLGERNKVWVFLFVNANKNSKYSWHSQQFLKFSPWRIARVVKSYSKNEQFCCLSLVLLLLLMSSLSSLFILLLMLLSTLSLMLLEVMYSIAFITRRFDRLQHRFSSCEGFFIRAGIPFVFEDCKGLAKVFLAKALFYGTTVTTVDLGGGQLFAVHVENPRY